jgi:methionyl aminopeptidase
MSIETADDLIGLKAIGAIVAQVLRRMRDAVRAGIRTSDLDDIARQELARLGAESSPRLVYQFPGETCISVNDEIVHGIPGQRVLRAGDLIKLDVTAQKDGYVADACVSVAVPPVSNETQRLIRCAERAFRKATKWARAGNRVRDIGAAVEQEVIRSGFRVVRELCGHGVGRTIHEAPEIPNYFDRNAITPLTKGLVITIEPIISAGMGRAFTASDGWTVRTYDQARSAHFEHTIVITENEPILLTA